MRAVVITRPGGPEVLALQNVPEPVAGAGEALIRVVAAGVNRADLLQRAGFYPPPPGAPPYPGLECAGIIAAVGAGVPGWQIGDPVCALLAGGGYAELVAVPVGQLLPVPHGVGLIEAAALPEAACTVHSMVFDIGRLQPGETILVHGGGGGVGTLAIQLAHAYGARVLTTAGSAHKLEVLRTLGAEIMINYREQDFVELVNEETSGRGVDVILDNIGGPYLARNLAALATGGRLVVLGLQGGQRGELNLATLVSKRARIASASLRARPLEEKAAIVTATATFVWPRLESGEVRPIVDRILPLGDVVEAHRVVEASDHIGKVLLQVREPESA